MSASPRQFPVDIEETLIPNIVTADLNAIVANQRPAVTVVPSIKTGGMNGQEPFTAPAQIYNKTIFSNSVTKTVTEETWLTETLADNPWLASIDYTVGGTGIINIKNQIFNGPITVDSSTGTVFSIYNSVFNADADIGLVWTATDADTFSLTPAELTKAQKFRNKLRNGWRRNLTAELGHLPRATKGAANFRDIKHNELVALNLLKSMVSAEVWRKYLKYGFVTVQGKSGLTYKIERNSWFIGVLYNGTKIGTLCVVLKDRGTIPPTDAIVAKMLICECDERDIWMRANVRWSSDDIRQHPSVLALGVQNKGYGKEEKIVYENYPRQNAGVIVNVA